MALIRMAIVTGGLAFALRWILPELSAGLEADALATVRVFSLLIWGVLTLTAVARSTKDVYWCSKCRCDRCQHINARKSSHDY